jgi:hypothetical protein
MADVMRGAHHSTSDFPRPDNAGRCLSVVCQERHAAVLVRWMLLSVRWQETTLDVMGLTPEEYRAHENAMNRLRREMQRTHFGVTCPRWSSATRRGGS